MEFKLATSWIILLMVLVMKTEAQIVIGKPSRNDSLSMNVKYNASCRQDECIELRKCHSATQRIASNSPQDLKFLESITCHFDNNKKPYVCCPEDEELLNRPAVQQLNTPATKPITQSPKPVACGKNNVTLNRIIGGAPAPKFTWPWMAAIFYDLSGLQKFNEVQCGGVLIYREFVLTAAHCVTVLRGIALLPLESLTVRLGDLDISSSDDGLVPLNLKVSKIIVHENYEPVNLENDIALLRLLSPVNFTESIGPICLPSSAVAKEDLSGFSPFSAGWEITEFGGNSSSVLMQVQLQIESNENCQSALPQKKIFPTQICAGDVFGRKDTCKGDSGGPLMFTWEEQWQVIGIVSFGYKCAQPEIPGVYTRVSEYLTWINKHVDA